MRLLRRLRWLDKSKKAVEFADCVLASELNRFEVLNTDDGARRLDCLVHIDPNRAMATLERLIGGEPKPKLRTLIEGRRYVVWALEKLAFRKETFVAAATLLRRLGAAETEDWGNERSRRIRRPLSAISWRDGSRSGDALGSPQGGACI